MAVARFLPFRMLLASARSSRSFSTTTAGTASSTPASVSLDLRLKRKLSAFNAFLQEQKGKGSMKEMAQLWGSLTAEEKAKYASLAAKTNENRPFVPKNTKPKMVTIEEKVPLRKLSAYIVFVQATFSSQPGATAKEKMQNVAKMWVALGEEGQKKYKELADAENVKRANMEKIRRVKVPITSLRRQKQVARPKKGAASPGRPGKSPEGANSGSAADPSTPSGAKP